MEIEVPLERVNDVTLVRLARDIARGIFPLDEILKNNRITTETWERIRELPLFLDILQEEMDVWTGAPNVKQRVHTKAGHATEELIPEMYARACDSNEPLAARVKIFEIMSKMAGTIQEKPENAAGETGKVTISINLGPETVNFEKNATKTIEATVENDDN